MLGQAQSGVRSSLRMLAVIDDEEVIDAARREATAIVAADPELAGLPALRTALDAYAARASLLRGRQLLGPSIGLPQLQNA